MIHDEATTNKLLIMFILDKLAMPIGEDLFLKICTFDNNWMNYMICRPVLTDLVKSGFIKSTKVANTTEGLLSLTDDGRTCLAHFYTDIPLSVREDVSETLSERIMDYRIKQECKADYYRNEDGTFTTDLKILDTEAKPVIDIKLVVGNRAIATGIFNSWPQKGPEVYQALHDILIGD